MSTAEQPGWWSRTWDAARDTAPQIAARPEREPGSRWWQNLWDATREAPGQAKEAARHGWRFGQYAYKDGKQMAKDGFIWTRDKSAEVGRASAKAAKTATAKGIAQAKKIIAAQRGAGLNERLIERSAMSVAAREPRRASDRDWQAGYIHAATKRIPAMQAAAKPLVVKEPEPARERLAIEAPKPVAREWEAERRGGWEPELG